MIIKINTLDIWRLGTERRIVVRSPEDYNKFCLISLGTGETTTKSLDGKSLFDYLVYGKNPLINKNRQNQDIKPIFVKEFNLRERFEQELPDFGGYSSIWVYSEDVTDEEILKYHNKSSIN